MTKKLPKIIKKWQKTIKMSLKLPKIEVL